MNKGMPTHPQIWNILLAHMPSGPWMSLEEAYGLVEGNAQLDREDFGPQSPTADIASGNEMFVMHRNAGKA